MTSLRIRASLILNMTKTSPRFMDLSTPQTLTTKFCRMAESVRGTTKAIIVFLVAMKTPTLNPISMKATQKKTLRLRYAPKVNVLNNLKLRSLRDFARAVKMSDLDGRGENWEALMREVWDEIYDIRRGVGVDFRERLRALVY